MRIAVPATLQPGAFAGWMPGGPVAELTGTTMGTSWRVQFAQPPGVNPAVLRLAIEALLDRLVGEMSHWEPASALGRFNRSPAASWTTLPPDFATVIAAALDMAERTEGAFDPGIGALVNIWGFGPDPVAHAPDAEAVGKARAVSGWRGLTFDPHARRLRQPGGLLLDLSGIAKGHAADRLAGLLAEHGVRHALVEIGGELVGRGIRPDGDPWWVELETPGNIIPPIRVALHQLAVATSGDYVRGRHTIDPRTGCPVSHALAISVIHPSAMLADAWATALGVLGPGAMQGAAIDAGLAVRALIRTADGTEEWISPALTRMIED